MKKHIIIVILSCFSFYTQAQNFQLEWHATHGDSLRDEVSDMTLDANRNLVMCGNFFGVIDVDPSTNIHNIFTPAGNTSFSAYVQKLDSNQNFLWAKPFNSTYDQGGAAYYTETDDSGNVYVYGFFKGDITFDGNTYYLSGLSNYGTIFLTKLDASGNVQWGRSWTTIKSTQAILPGGFKVSKYGDIYLGLSFTDSLDMDPSSNSVQYFKSMGGSDGMLLKLNSNGELTKTRQIGSSSINNYVEQVAIDDHENVFIGGEFSGTINFDNTGGSKLRTAVGSSDMFIEKLDSSLMHQEVFAFIGSSGGIRGMSLSASGALYCSGIFKGTIDFDLSPANNSVSTINNKEDAFVLRLKPTTHQFDWVSIVSGLDREYINHFDISPNGSALLVGNFESTANFGVGTNVQSLTSNGNRDSYIWTIDSLGNSLNLEQYGMLGNDYFRTCQHISNHEFYVGGTYQNNLDLDPNGAGTVINSVGDYDIVYAKMSICQPQDTTLALTACGSYTVPSGNQTYTTSGIYKDTLAAISGCDSVLTINLTIAPNSFLPSITQTANGLEATASGSNLSFQWLDCQTNQLVAGATSQTFMPLANGDYAVIVSDSLCSDTSACFSINNVSINEEVLLDQIVVYPNPTTGLLNIETNSTLQNIEVSDLMGRVLLTVKDPKSSVDLSRLPKGVYLVKVKTELGEVVRRVVKE